MIDVPKNDSVVHGASVETSPRAPTSEPGVRVLGTNPRSATLFSPGNGRRVALVLGGGGPAGHAFHAGGLLALSELFSWEPRDADLLVGTSAGAQVAALLRGGMSAHDLAARVTGRPMSESGVVLARHFIRPEYARALASRQLRRRLAAPRLGFRIFRGQLGIGLAGLLPEGYVDLSVQAAQLRGFFGMEWPQRPLWIVAVSLATGKRVVFGHPEGPRVDVGTAVASSGAIPSVCRPVQIGGHRYVDGGFASFTNLDLVDGNQYDWIVVSSPLSRYAPIRWRMQAQVRRLRRDGARILLLEPNAATRRAIGRSMMDLSRAPSVCDATARQVREYFDQAEKKDVPSRRLVAEPNER